MKRILTRMHKRVKWIALCIIIICMANPILWSGDIARCKICGMDVSQYPHTKYIVTATDGEKLRTCGAQCGIELHIQLKGKFKSATATDLLSNRSIDAQNAYYVYKSTVITDMSPGFVVFAKKANAEKFKKGFGGQVVTYKEALQLCKTLMK